MDNISFFKSLTLEEQEYLKKNRSIKEYSKGEFIFTPEDICENLCVVIEGELRLLKYPSDSQEYILHILEPGDIFGEAILFEKTNYPVYVMCSRKASIGVIPKGIIIKLMMSNSQFMEQYLNILCGKIKNLNKKIDMLTRTNIKSRILLYLRQLQEEQKSSRVHLNMTKQTLALLLGTSREVLSRNFSELEKEGFIAQDKEYIEILQYEE